MTKWHYIAPIIVLFGCDAEQPPEKPAPANACHVPSQMTPSPVWPDNCVADWYATATLPECVEDYLRSVKAQQKAIVKKHKQRKVGK